MRTAGGGFFLGLISLTACGGATTSGDAGVDATGADAGLVDLGARDLGMPDVGVHDSGCTTDADGDGHASIACGGDDCDDTDAHRYPGNAEVCDTTNHDEDCAPTTFGFRDSDSDGYPDILCCNADPAGGTHCGTDCDDANTNVHPSQTETCNHVDDNCDGVVDEGALVSYFADCDGDGRGAGTPAMGCSPPTTAPSCAGGVWLTVGGDCDDADMRRAPGNPEVCDATGLDEDCNPATLGPDADGDGGAPTYCCDTQPDATLLCGSDCNDAASTVHTGAVETCNGIDDDCDRTRDDGLSGCTATIPDTGIIVCGGASCPLATNTCCEDGSAAGTCTAGATASCSSLITAHCDGPEDCAGDVCCGNFSTRVAACATSCAGSTLKLCHEDADCTAPTVCTPFRLGGVGTVLAHTCQ